MQNSFTEAELIKFQKEFDNFDLDASGAIDEDELSIVLKVRQYVLTQHTVYRVLSSSWQCNHT